MSEITFWLEVKADHMLELPGHRCWMMWSAFLPSVPDMMLHRVSERT